MDPREQKLRSADENAELHAAAGMRRDGLNKEQREKLDRAIGIPTTSAVREGEVKPGEKFFKVAVSAPGRMDGAGNRFEGYWCLQRFWPKGQTEAVLTESQLAEIKADGNLGIIVIGAATVADYDKYTAEEAARKNRPAPKALASSSEWSALANAELRKPEDPDAFEASGGKKSSTARRA